MSKNIFDTLELKVIEDKNASENPFSPKFNLHKLSGVKWAENDHKSEIDSSDTLDDVHATPNEREMLKTKQDLQDAQEITEALAKRNKKRYSQEERVSNKYKNKITLEDIGNLLEEKLANKTKKELLTVAKNLNIKGRNNMRKANLVKAIMQNHAKDPDHSLVI
ncbi:MAG: Rho termination factor N-terminal domain-containing protein [Elusimicrobiota bacterium]